MVLTIAREHAACARALENCLEINKPVDLLCADVASAIDRATEFDERDMNHNFAVDWGAYAEVQKGLSQLVEQGHLEDAKSLAIRLMKDGSYQVECSDEGMMTDDIIACLNPVVRAVKAAGGDEAIEWAEAMQRSDRVGFICDRELAELRGER